MMLKDKNGTNNLTDPTITVIMPTFNHRDFISEAIESVLMQEVDFGVEILLHDDCSTDGTTDIVRSYAKEYPNIIRPFFQKENQYSQGRKPIRLLLPVARGRYVTLLEGDDVWTDPSKLNKQLAFLDQNPQYIMSFGNARIVDAKGEVLAALKIPPQNCRHQTHEDVMTFNAVMPTSTIMFRNHPILKKLPGNPGRIYNGDIFLFAILAQYGPAGYVDIVPSLYRQHAGGIYSSLSDTEKVARSLTTVKELHACVVPEYRPLVAGAMVNRYQWLSKLLRKDGQRWKLVQNFFSLVMFSLRNRPFRKFMEDSKKASRLMAKAFLRDGPGFAVNSRKL